MKVLIKGSIFPQAGFSYRIYSLAFALHKYCELILLEEKHEVAIQNESRYKIFKCVYFYNPFRILNTSFGSFFADLNPTYYHSIFRIIEREKPDIIQISFPYGIFSARLINTLRGKARIVYDAHNVEADMVKIYMNNPNTPLPKKLIIAGMTPFIEKLAVSSADHIITISELDRQRFIERYGISGDKISVIPVGVSLPDLQVFNSNREKENSEITILFHGSYNYFPNREAVNVILNKIAPEIMKKHKNVIFILAGTNMPKFKKQNIVSLGYVDNLSQLISSCDIAIVPITQGGGVRVKILDYMAFGKPIVTTSKGIEGIEAENGKHAIIVNDVDEKFIEAIEYLIENEEKKRSLGKEARKLAEEKYDIQKIGKKLYQLYINLGSYS